MMSFAYKPPGPDSPPLYDGTQAAWDPVSIYWKPEIWDCSRIIKHGNSTLVADPTIPWDLNIREIWVESRKTFEILCLCPRPHGRNPLVRICPPILPDLNQKRKLYDLVICSESADDLHLAHAIAFRYPAIIAHRTKHWGLMAYAKTVIFALDRLGPLYHLAYAVAAGCRIVASDAGAAEEYLCNYAPPATWRVIHHGYAVEKYLAAAEFLRGNDAPVVPTNFLDRTP